MYTIFAYECQDDVSSISFFTSALNYFLVIDFIIEIIIVKMVLQFR